jgi:hypothetical protein
MADTRQPQRQVDPSEFPINESTPGAVEEAEEAQKAEDVQDESEISE